MADRQIAGAAPGDFGGNDGEDRDFRQSEPGGELRGSRPEAAQQRRRARLSLERGLEPQRRAVAGLGLVPEPPPRLLLRPHKLSRGRLREGAESYVKPG